MEPTKTAMGQACLFPSPWRWTRFASVALLTLHLLSGRCRGDTPVANTTYHSYDMTSDRVCNRFHKREFHVLFTEPLIVESRAASLERLSSGGSAALNCNFEVEARGSSSKYGVTSVVQAMNFRSQGDFCVDYIQTIYKEEKKGGTKIKIYKKKKDKTRKVLKQVVKTAAKHRHKRDSDSDRGARICGRVLLGLHVDANDTMPPPFANPLPPTPPQGSQSLLGSVLLDAPNPYQTLVSDASDVDTKGDLKTHLFVSNRMSRLGEDPVKLKIVYTVYQECDGRSVPRNLFHCGYGMCISSLLVNDGLVNCPFGDCIDETNCTNAKAANITARVVRYKPTVAASSSGVSKSGTWTIIVVVLIVVLSCGAVYYCISKKRKRSKEKQAEREEDDLDDEFADPSKQQQAQQPQQQPMAADNVYPTPAPPPGGVPGYGPPPGGQPGYYPMVPQPGYAPYPQQQPPYPGQQPPYPEQQPPYPGQPPPPGYPMPPPGAYPPQQQQPATSGPPGSAYPMQGQQPAYPTPPQDAAPLQSTDAPPPQQGAAPMGFAYPQSNAPYPVAETGAPPPVNA